MNRDDRMNANMQALIKILMDTDKPMSIHDIRQKAVLKQIDTDASVRNYLRKLPEHLDEDHELIIRQHGRKYGYQIIDKRDRYPISKTESGYPDPTAAKAMVTVMHSKPFGDYMPGTVWPIRVGNYARTFLVIGCEPDTPLKTAYFLYGVEAFDEQEAERRKIDLADARIVPISETLYADTKFIFTRHSRYVIRRDGEFRFIRISKEKFDIVKGMVGQRMLMGTEAQLTCEQEKLKMERIDRATEVYALKTKIKKLEAQLAEKGTEQTLDELKIENAILRGKVQAYESVTNLTRKPLYATKSDVIAGNILNEMANRRGLASQILFGKGDKMKDAVRAKDPIFEAIKTWGQEHPDVVVHLAYDPEQLKIRFRMTWLPNSAINVEHDVDFIVYDQRKSSDEATAEFTFNVLDTMYQEGGYGHE